MPKNQPKMDLNSPRNVKLSNHHQETAETNSQWHAVENIQQGKLSFEIIRFLLTILFQISIQANWKATMLCWQGFHYIQKLLYRWNTLCWLMLISNCMQIWFLIDDSYFQNIHSLKHVYLLLLFLKLSISACALPACSHTLVTTRRRYGSGVA